MKISIESLYKDKETILKEIGNQILNLQGMEVSQVVDADVNDYSTNTKSVDEYKKLIDKQWDKKPIYHKSEIKERIELFKELRKKIQSYDTDDIDKLTDIIRINNLINSEKMELNNVIDCIYDALGLNSTLTKKEAISREIGNQIIVMQHMEMFQVNGNNIDQYKSEIEKQWINENLYEKNIIIAKKEKYSKLRLKLNNFNGNKKDLEEIVNLFNELSNNKLIYKNGVLRRGFEHIKSNDRMDQEPDLHNSNTNDNDNYNDFDNKMNKNENTIIDDFQDSDLDNDLDNSTPSNKTIIDDSMSDDKTNNNNNDSKDFVQNQPQPVKKRRRIISRVKKQISTHKKAVLISLAIATLLIMLPHAYPFMATTLMAKNAALWKIMPSGIQSLLHGSNVILSKTLELMGISTNFVESTGVWTVGGVEGIGKVFLTQLKSNAALSAITALIGGGALKLVKDKMPEHINVGTEEIDKEVTEEELLDFLEKKKSNKYIRTRKKIRNVVDEKTKEELTEEIIEVKGLERISLMTMLKEKFRKIKDKRKQEQDYFAPEYNELLDNMLSDLNSAQSYEEFDKLVESYKQEIDEFSIDGKTDEEIEFIKSNLYDNLNKIVAFENERFVSIKANNKVEKSYVADKSNEFNNIFTKYKEEIVDSFVMSIEEKKELLQKLKDEIMKIEDPQNELQKANGEKKL